MKSGFVIGILSVLLVGTPAFGGYGLRSLLFEDFEGISPPGLPAGWTTLNANGDQGTWDSKGFGGYRGGPICIRYVRDQVTAADDWFFTSGLYLESSDQYALEFMYRASASGYPEALSIFAGTAQDPDSMSLPIWSNLSITNTDYLKGSNGFMVPAPGTYYIGFHAESPAGMRRLYVDDVNLSTPEEELDLRLGLTREIYQTGMLTYSLGDTIDCMAYIVNNGATTWIINNAFAVGAGGKQTQLEFEIADPLGQILPCVVAYEKMVPLQAQHFALIHPDSVSGKFLDLYQWYDFQTAGQHTVQVYYRNYADPFGMGAWMGQLVSDSVVISIE